MTTLERKFVSGPRFGGEADEADEHRVAVLDVEGRTVRGYASVFGVLDRHGDIMQRGCFKNSIAQRSTKLRFLWMHDQRQPLAIPRLEEDSKGLVMEATLPEGRHQDFALDNIRNGLVDGLSIGFNTVAYEIFEDEEMRAQLRGWARYAPMRRMIEVELVETSAVTFPSNEASRIEEVRDGFGVCKKPMVGWSPRADGAAQQPPNGAGHLQPDDTRVEPTIGTPPAPSADTVPDGGDASQTADVVEERETPEPSSTQQPSADTGDDGPRSTIVTLDEAHTAEMRKALHEFQEALTYKRLREIINNLSG